jgi:hypothetical protein
MSVGINMIQTLLNIKTFVLYRIGYNQDYKS